MQEPTKYDMEKVTIYRRGEMFGVRGVEAKLIQIGKADYAQYRDAVFVDYVARGKRTPMRSRLTSYPFMVIVKGWGHAACPDAMTTAESLGNGLVVRQSKYASCSDEYQHDFNAWFLTQKMEIIFDCRYTLDTTTQKVAS